MNGLIQKTIKNKTVMAVLSIVLGIYLIIRQSSAVSDLIHVIGLLILVADVINLIAWAFDKDNRNSASLTMVIIGAIIGGIFMAAPSWLVSIFPVLMGIALIINSVSNITGLTHAGSKGTSFTTSLILSILSLVLGILVLFHPSVIANILIAVVGITFLVNGISDLMFLSAAKD